MLLSNYLQMIHEQMKMIEQVSWTLEWIVSVNYIIKDDQYSYPWCKLALKHKNVINKDKLRKLNKWKIGIFLINDQLVFLLDPPTKEVKNSKNIKHLILMNVQNIFWCFLFYLRNIIYLAKIMRALLSNKMEFHIFEKVNNSIATKLGMTLLNNHKHFWLFFCTTQFYD